MHIGIATDHGGFGVKEELPRSGDGKNLTPPPSPPHYGAPSRPPIPPPSPPDHTNILCMGRRTIGPEVAWDLVQTYLAAEYSNAPRHLRRLGKVAALKSERKTP